MAELTLVSVQVGKPQRHDRDDGGKAWQSGIFKAPVEGPVWLGSLNLNGDGQADTDNHGGPFRAVLGYGASHYPTWREELAMPDLPYGAFGENFTINGLTESTVCLGDVYTIGEAQVQVTQPRQPCWKLARRWGLRELTALVLRSNRGGWYHQVLTEGWVEAGMPMTLVERSYPCFSIAFLNGLLHGWVEDPVAMRDLGEVDVLTPSWRQMFANRAAEYVL